MGKKRQVNNNEIERAVDEKKSQTLHLDWWAFIVAGVITALLVIFTYTQVKPIKATNDGVVTKIDDVNPDDPDYKERKGEGPIVFVDYQGQSESYRNLWPVFVSENQKVTTNQLIGWAWPKKGLKIPFKEVVKPLLPKDNKKPAPKDSAIIDSLRTGRHS